MSHIATAANSPAGPRAPVRRSIYSKNLLHGSEEGLGGDVGTQNCSQACPDIVAVNSPDAVVRDDVPNIINDPMDKWDAARVATFLEEMKVSEETIAEVVAEQIDGSMLTLILTDSDVHETLVETLLIKNPPLRPPPDTHTV